jgi:hypothetical protein
LLNSVVGGDRKLVFGCKALTVFTSAGQEFACRKNVTRQTDIAGSVCDG